MILSGDIGTCSTMRLSANANNATVANHHGQTHSIRHQETDHRP